jgi:hypothetical protein
MPGHLHIVSAKWLHADYIVASSDSKQVNVWALKDLMGAVGATTKKNKRRKVTTGNMIAESGAEEESKTESSIIKQVEEKPLTIFGTISSRVIF